MRRPVVVRVAAERDLALHALHIHRDHADAAARFLDAFDDLVERLAEHPALGRKRRMTDPLLADLRSLAMPGFTTYLVFYRAVAGSVEVLRVLHGAQDIERILGD